MGRKYVKLIGTAVVLAVVADTAWAQFFPGPFAFSFFTQGLVEFFLLPLTLAGCV